MLALLLVTVFVVVFCAVVNAANVVLPAATNEGLTQERQPQHDPRA